MDKLPEYLRETVDWFMGKTGRGRRGDRPDGSSSASPDGSGGGSDGQKLYLQPPLLELRVPETEIIFLTLLPEGLDHAEWMASHTIGFFEHINLLYGTISEFCTPSTCPEMNGPGPRQYTWVDDKGKKSRLSAPQYIDYIMTYAQRTINDESIFPTKHGLEFPSGFDAHLRKLHRLLFHVLAHIYHAHFKEIVLLQLHAHLNALFAHFVEFNLRFHTVEDKEMEVLSDLVVALRLVPPLHDSTASSSSSMGADSEEENRENNSVTLTASSSATINAAIVNNGAAAAADDEDNADVVVVPAASSASSDSVICRQPTNSAEFPMPTTTTTVRQQEDDDEDNNVENCVEMTEGEIV